MKPLAYSLKNIKEDTKNNEPIPHCRDIGQPIIKPNNLPAPEKKYICSVRFKDNIIVQRKFWLDNYDYQMQSDMDGNIADIKLDQLPGTMSLFSPCEALASII